MGGIGPIGLLLKHIVPALATIAVLTLLRRADPAPRRRGSALDQSLPSAKGDLLRRHRLRPIVPNFGPGVRDIRVEMRRPLFCWLSWGFFTQTLYWDWDVTQKTRCHLHLTQLREALAISGDPIATAHHSAKAPVEIS
jgi:hypothetical protein